MMHGLRELTEQKIRETPYLRRFQALIQTLGGGMHARAAERLPLFQLAAVADESEIVTLVETLPGDTPAITIEKLRQAAQNPKVMAVGFCIRVDRTVPGALSPVPFDQIHLEDRVKPGDAFLSGKPLNDRHAVTGMPGIESPAAQGYKKRIPALIFLS